jgi:hypothetical protein
VDRDKRRYNYLANRGDDAAPLRRKDALMAALNLLPAPHSLSLADGSHALSPGRLIVIEGAPPADMIAGARRVQRALSKHAGLLWDVSASAAVPPEQVGAHIRVDADAVPQPQGYTLRISEGGIAITAHDAAGAFYGACTLAQIIAAEDEVLPYLQISDWPDFPVRGVMLDVSRDKVPQLGTLLDLVDMLAGWKINQLQLYTEHTFAYRQHPEVWADASPITGEEIIELDAFCRERFVELVPNQNSFGHMHRWLRHPRYAALAETHEEFDTPWNMRMKGPFGLAPEDPGSIALIGSLYDELLPHFSSRMVNVGCDETIDLGQGRSKQAVEQRGAGRVYLDFLLKIYEQVKRHGRTMQFWGDIIIHHPELIPELPKDAIVLEWGYEANHPFAEHCPQFAAAGLPFYVCPGTSAWCSIAGRTNNALGNLASAAENGLRHGAAGYLITDWGDNGHWQTLPASYLGFAMGAAYSWAYEANRARDVPQAVSAHAFGDPTGSAGRVAYDLGNVYRAVGLEPGNSSVLFWTLLRPLADLDEEEPRVPAPAFRKALAAIDDALAPLEQARIGRPDAEQTRRELELAARMLRHSCRRALLALRDEGLNGPQTRRELADDMRGIIGEYEELWLGRNRRGGLRDSVARLQRALQDYAAE